MRVNLEIDTFLNDVAHHDSVGQCAVLIVAEVRTARAPCITFPNVGRRDDRDTLWARVAAGASLLLTGDAGVGKSHLAQCLLDDAAALGWSTQLIAATPAVQAVSFGAVHELLSTEQLDHVSLMNRAIDELAQRADGRRQLVVVDDINSLDADSLALVDRLARGDVSTVLATVRSSNVDGLELSALWKDQVLELVEVQPFDRTATDAMVRSLLGPAVSEALLDEIWELTEGNALFVRELLLGAQAQGRVTQDADGHWISVARLAMTNRLIGIITNRLDSLDPGQLDAMITVACSEPIDVVAIDRVFGNEVLESLEVAGFINVAGTKPGKALVRMAHPMIGEVLREGTSRARRLTLLGRLAETMLANAAALDPDTRQRALRWALDAGVDFDPSLLLGAAERALFRFDHETAAALAGPALEYRPSSRVAQILSRSLYLAKRYDEAADAAQRGLALAETEDDRCDLLVVWADIEMMGRSNLRGGIERLRHELVSFSQPESRAELEMRIRVGEALAGDLLDTIDTSADLSSEASMPLSARVHVIAGVAYSLLMSGNAGEDLQRQVTAGLALTNDDPENWIHNLLLKMLELYAEVQQGRIGESTAKAKAHAALAHDKSEQSGWSVVPALAAATAGAGLDAIEAGEEAARLLEQSDPYGVELWGDGVAALGHARQGNTAEAQRCIDRACAHGQASQARLAVFVRTAQAWQLLHAGDEEAAVAAAVAAADAAAEEDHFFFAAMVKHDVARMGRPELVVDDLARWAADGHGVVIGLFAAHVRALINADRSQLERVGQAFLDIDAPALAAEALGAAARYATPDDAVRLLSLAQVAAADAGWEDSVTLAGVDFLLSERELQVARAAARGLSNKEIAAELFLSFRTVGNHLHAVYRKLRISTRSELAEHLCISSKRAESPAPT